jgi:hypothetical protein
MESLKRIVFSLSLLFALVVVGQAQRNSIEGRVVGPDGQGILDARVILKNTNLTDVGQDITDSKETTASRICLMEFITLRFYLWERHTTAKRFG